MNVTRQSQTPILIAIASVLLLFGCSKDSKEIPVSSSAEVGLDTASVAQAPIIQPGAPGEPARELSAEEAIEIADTSHSPADALFMGSCRR